MKNVEVDIEKIHNLFFCYANKDFSTKVEVSNEGDYTDTIISGVKMLGEELEESSVSKEFFKSIFNSISDVIIVTNTKGIITQINNAASAMLNINAIDFVGMNVRSILMNLFKYNDLAYLKSKLVSNDKYSFETTLMQRNSKRYFLITITRIKSRIIDQAGFLLVIKDITHEKILESEIIKAIIETEEKEKIRFAHDIHDALGQELNSVKMLLESLMLMDRNSEKYSNVMSLCKDIMNACIQNARYLSHDLMPKSLEDNQLFMALEELKQSHKDLLKIEIIRPNKEYGLSNVSKINIYRIFQEFVTNSLKHGDVKEVIFETIKKNGIYYFTMRDNGCGFNLNDNYEGRGLRNIKSRLLAINAAFELMSNKNEGTQLKFNLK